MGAGGYRGPRGQGVQEPMYQFSRAIYREISPKIIEGTGECARKQHVLDACESTMQRLLTDRRYFAKPTKALFSDLRNHFPIGEQLFVYRVVDRNVRLALQYLDTVPDRGADAGGIARVPRAHPPRHALSARAAAGSGLLPLPQAPRRGPGPRPAARGLTGLRHRVNVLRTPLWGALRDVRRQDQSIIVRCSWASTSAGPSPTPSSSTPMAGRSGRRRRRRPRRISPRG